MTQHHAPTGADNTMPTGAPQQHVPGPGQIPPGIAFPGHPGYDPKAAAKAAKAYAKAQRPWFKKKRFIVPLAFVALIVVISLGSGGDDSGTPSVDPAPVAADKGNADKGGEGTRAKAESASAPKAEKAPPGSQDNPAKIGDTVTLEGTKYTVDNVRTTKTLGDDYFSEKANGRFVVITLTLENTKDDTRTFSSGAAKLVAGNGKTYETTTDALFAVDDNLIFEEMQPDLPMSGTLVFDVPPAAMKGMLLEVSNLFGRGEAYVDLGL